MSDSTDMNPQVTLDYIKTMEAKGFRIVHSTDNLILLDFDEPFNKEAVANWEHGSGDCLYGIPEMWDMFFEFFPDSTVKWSPSKNGNTHCIIDMRTQGVSAPLARIAIQACLGSDPKKEFLSIMRSLRGFPEYSLLAIKPNG